MQYLDEDVLQAFDVGEFMSTRPSPWTSFDGILTEEAFQALNDDYPSLELFERHSGMMRGNGQRPHDRWYLALEHSIYDSKAPDMQGCVDLEELPDVWQGFIQCLRESSSYQNMIRQALGDEMATLRFAWHVAGQGADVSPHVDDPLKAGTHIFYFNTSTTWKEEWGGQTLFLCDPGSNLQNPEIEEFGAAVAAPITDNKSMLFRNAPSAWHGVAKIRCEPGKYRRLFNAIFQLPNRPGGRPGLFKRISARARRSLIGR